MYKTLYTKENDGILKVYFNNPEKLNVLTETFLYEFNKILDMVDEKDDIKVVILSGKGKAFVAGADISHMVEMRPYEAAEYSKDTTDMYTRMENMNKIFIAAINGFTFGGGCELALACDLRIASKTAKIGLPEVSLGILPGGGGTQRLPRLIGDTKAKELIFTGKTISGEEAEQMGLVNFAVDINELEQKAEELACAITNNSTYSVGLAKQCINNGKQCDITTGNVFERNAFALCFDSDDQKQKMRHFLNKSSSK